MITTDTLIVAGIALLLAGCSATRLPPNAQGVSFPVKDASYRDSGIVVAPATLGQVRPGLNKDQVRLLLGNPHFTEGLFFVNDWNYLIEWVAPQGHKLSCQLQLPFDEDGKVMAIHWQTAECAEAARPPVSAAMAADAPEAASVAPPSAPVASESLSLHGLLFPFGRSGLDDLPQEDLARLEAFAESVSADAQRVQDITIHGHSDRLGPPERRLLRSQLRARSVAEVFTRRGIDPARIRIVAQGAAEPVTDCSSRLAYPQLLGCLAPDRRVTIAVRLAGR